MFSILSRQPQPPPTPERNLVAVMPPGTIMRYLQDNYPERMTASGAIDAGQFPTGQDAANWAVAVTRHIMPDAQCQALPDLEYARRWLE